MRSHSTFLRAACASILASALGCQESRRTADPAVRSSSLSMGVRPAGYRWNPDPESQAATRGKSPWSFGDVPEPTDRTAGVGSLTLTEIGRFGTEEGPGWLASLHTAAVSRAWLASSAFRSCEIVVFDRSTRKERARFGQCGGGPGDFNQLGAMLWRNDTLVISDRYGRRLQFFSLDGVLYRTVIVDSSVVPESANGIRQLAPASDTSLFVVIAHAANRLVKGTVVAPYHRAAYVREIGPSGRDLGFSALEDGEGPRQLSFGMVRNISACVTATPNRPSSFLLFGINRWRSQIVELDVDAHRSGREAVRMNRVLTEVPIGAFRSDQKPPRMTSHSMDLGCGQRLVVGSYRRWTHPDPDNRTPTQAYLVGISPVTGQHTVRHVRDDFPAALGKLLAAHGDSFFFGHSDRYGFPRIVEVRITQGL